MISNVFGTTNIDELCEELFKPKNHPALIFYVSWYRGGGEQSGSIVWADVREHNEIPNKYLMPYYQIFGHTYARNPIIEKHWAMLDYGKSCFILDEESLHNV